ncbi:MAG: ABC transporter ATP-binding protein [Chlorobi bacterium]|nr:ABC transporter ATP-binding protein [Chlorobiota bacterium]
MTNYSFILQDLTKSFSRRLIFKNINAEFNSGSVYGLAGSNGSGKSTLAKIIAGLLSPTSGKVIHKFEDKEVPMEKLHDHLGFVSPYLVLYDEFTAEENLTHFLKIRGIEIDNEKIKTLLNDFSLYGRRNDLLKAYSSGMKQRMKFIFSLIHSPELLILDEPTSNLDIEGKDKVYEIIERESKNKLIVIASNEESDLALCKEIIYVEEYKK